MSNETCMSVHGDLLAGLALEPEKKKKKQVQFRCLGKGRSLIPRHSLNYLSLLLELSSRLGTPAKRLVSQAVSQWEVK